MNTLHALGSTGKAFDGSHAAKAAAQPDASSALDWFGMMPNPLATQTDGASFASLFAGASNAASPNAQNADPVAQLASLLQNGTPMSTIVDRLAQQLAGAVAHALPGQTNAASNARLKSSLVQSIANALAPPGNAPPGTAAEQAAALAQRLHEWIAGIAGDAKTTAGQQNDISGKLLDAKSAKDIPAQRKTETASTNVDPAALTQALLSSVVAAFTPAQSGNGSAPANAQPQSSTANAAASAQTGAAVPAPSITMANAPDVLARMLVRAAGVDARVNGVAPVSGSGSIDTTPAALAARFANAIASAALGSGSGAQGNSNGSNAGRDGSPQPDTAQTQTPSGPSSAGAAAVSVPVSTTSFATMTQTQTQTPVDANAIVEQVVKSMVMRTSQSGSSEIRLRLNPDNLGEVTMKITVSGSSIDANVVAANSDVRNALISNHQHLAQSLSEAGLTLTGFSVDVSGGDAGRDQNRDRASGFGRRYAVHEIGGSADESNIAESSSPGPQLLPRTSLDLFNYLA